MKQILMKIIGIFCILIAIYFYVSFESKDLVMNPMREMCNVFGVASGFVCLYLGAVNWFIVCIFSGFGYAFLTYKIKPNQPPSV